MVKLVNCNNAEIIKFIREHGPEVFVGDLHQLDQYLDYFASINRVFLLRDKKQRLVGVACCTNVDSPEFLDKGEWPQEVPNGNVVFCHGIVVHKKARHINIMAVMLWEWIKLFPNIRYILFQRHEKGGKYKLMPVSKLIRIEGSK